MKKLNNQQLIIFTCLLATQLFLTNNASTNNTEDTVAFERINVADNTIIPVPKVLIHEKMGIVQKYLKKFPNHVALIVKANDRIDSTIKKLEEIEAKLAAKGLNEQAIAAVVNKNIGKLSKQVLNPINGFLIPLNTFCASIIEPLVQESLSRAGIAYQESALYKFFTVKMSNPEMQTFFNDHMKTKEDFLAECFTFKIFFADLEASMQEEFAQARASLET